MTKTIRIGGRLVEVPMGPVMSIAERTIASLKRLNDAIENDTPIRVTIATVEHTPDGPLTTLNRAVMRPSELRDRLRKDDE